MKEKLIKRSLIIMLSMVDCDYIFRNNLQTTEAALDVEAESAILVDAKQVKFFIKKMLIFFQLQV